MYFDQSILISDINFQTIIFQLDSSSNYHQLLVKDYSSEDDKLFLIQEIKILNLDWLVLFVLLQQKMRIRNVYFGKLWTELSSMAEKTGFC